MTLRVLEPDFARLVFRGPKPSENGRPLADAGEDRIDRLIGVTDSVLSDFINPKEHLIVSHEPIIVVTFFAGFCSNRCSGAPFAIA